MPDRPRMVRRVVHIVKSRRILIKQAGQTYKRHGSAANMVQKAVDLLRRKGARGFADVLRLKLIVSVPTTWYDMYRGRRRYKSVTWQGSTRFSVVMPCYKVRPEWLEEAIGSVMRQTYPHWELICVDDYSQDEALSEVLREAARKDARVRVVALDRNGGVSHATNIGLDHAQGDYVLFMDHDDVLEPHALARLGDAAFLEEADLLYGDEVVTSDSMDVILGVQSRPVFSHIYYLSYPFFVHPLAVRTGIARQIGGLNPSLTVCQDVDFVLRALEVARKVTHVPDILYKWRTNETSLGHARQALVTDIGCSIKSEHLRRLGFADASVFPGGVFNTFAVRYFATIAGRILAIIPTKNRGDLLRQCIETMRRTTLGLDLDIAVVDHQSDEPATQDYLASIARAGKARVIPYVGKFNYSAINNAAVKAAGAGYDYFLFLNNDIEAIKPGWLDSMLDLAARADVGAVGATLLYPDGRIQHSGVVVGLQGAAEHGFKTMPYGVEDPGYLCGLYATRECSAVTAACMLVPATVFNEVSGFDEALEVGFNDTDLCLRIGLKGYRIVNSAEAVLVHHESASRGGSADGIDPHPEDSALFCSRYERIIATGDPHFPPLLARDNPTFVLDAGARLSPKIRYESSIDILPKGLRPPKDGSAA